MADAGPTPGKYVRFSRYEADRQVAATEGPPKSLPELLYEQASQAAAIFEALGPVPPLTRRQRWMFRLEEARRRCRRAWDALRGRDEE